MTVSFAPLRPPVPAPLEAMTFPAYRHLLAPAPAPTVLREPNARRVQPVAMAAFREGEPVALALAGLPLEGDEPPELLSLYVVPAARRQGLDRALRAPLVGMRFPEEVVGWVINHALDEDTLRFICRYIRQDYRRRGRILPLYSESINPMREPGFTRCSCIAPLHHPTMAAFVRRWMAPWAGTVQETLGSTKSLVDPAATPTAAAARPEE